MNDPRRPLDLIRAARQLLQNPYAYIEDLEENDEREAQNLVAIATVTAPMRTGPERQAISKENFRALCTQIFLPYVPRHQPRRIAKHHRDFITRNENRTSHARYRLVEALRRYDLSTTVGIRPHFNREHQGGLTERKLRDIEVSIVDE